ncbi:MAG: MmcQ/YjbR family DNA-binding protein [Myxococcota bacterium]
MTWEKLCELFLAYPGVEESSSYGTPAFKVRKKLLVRVHQREPALVMRVESVDEQEALIEMDPKVFYVIDHYEGLPWVLARTSKLRKTQARALFEAAWRAQASKEQLAEFDDA